MASLTFGRSGVSFFTAKNTGKQLWLERANEMVVQTEKCLQTGGKAGLQVA